jgi:tRNA threonylcarbamoyladenosine biosynthesis protein TsaB
VNKILIDTSAANKISIVLSTEEQQFVRESEQKFGSQVLLSTITDLFKEAGIQFKDLTEIEVATGPGSYTGLRVGVSVANALGYSLNIPVNGKKLETEVVY